MQTCRIVPCIVMAVMGVAVESMYALRTVSFSLAHTRGRALPSVQCSVVLHW